MRAALGALVLYEGKVFAYVGDGLLRKRSVKPPRLPLVTLRGRVHSPSKPDRFMTARKIKFGSRFGFRASPMLLLRDVIAKWRRWEIVSLQV
jgi:hypothetical protein